MKQLNWKSWWPHLAVIALFLAITLVYFSPLLNGKDLQQMDMTHATGMAKELKTFHEKTGEYSQWTNSMFSGMTAYNVGPYTANYNIFNYLSRIFTFGLSPLSAGIVMLTLMGMYFLLSVLKFNPWVSAAGSIAYAFSSYNFIIIAAGHVSKAYAIALIPPAVAGVVLLYEGRYLWGTLIMTVGLGMNIARNHMQITYYTAILCGILVLGYFVHALYKKELKHFFTASALFVVAAIFAALPNAITLYSNYEMGKESIRGKSELTVKETSVKSKGLDKDYAFAWSYGVGESLSVLIPNFHGGASGTKLSTDSHLYKALKENGVQNPKSYINQAPTYWGDMPFTSGPAYHGAVICFLFILGLFIVRHQLKWWLLAATVVSLLLAWGRHFPAFNDLMFYYLPMYSKFRAVSTTMVIAGFTMPFLGMLAVKEYLEGLSDKKRMLDGLKWAAGITGGLSLLFALMPGIFFDFTSSSDSQITSQVPEWFYTALLQDRESLLKADAWRSFAYVLLSAGVLWGVLIRPQFAKYAGVALLVLVLADMWTVNKRYLNDDHFVSAKKKVDFAESVADKAILQDTDPSFRVLNLNNPFNEVNTSYFHKSIGGYHGAKLRRYQELIEHNLEPELKSLIAVLMSQPDYNKIDSAKQSLKVLNMLNARYFIYSPQAAPMVNQYAYGNAWFVSAVQIVPDADAEMAGLAAIEPKTTALVDRRFEETVKGFTPVADSLASITLTSYAPNKLVYESNTSAPQFALFSEVYYPHGWKAYVDGQLTPHVRANWILRGMIIPEGKHTVEFRYEPDAFRASQKAAMAGSFVVGLLLIGSIGFSLVKRKE